MCGGRDGARDGLDGAEIGFSVLQRGRSDADKNGASLLDSFGGRDELQTARLGIAFDEQIQMGLEKRQAASIELFKLAYKAIEKATTAKDKLKAYTKVRLCKISKLGNLS